MRGPKPLMIELSTDERQGLELLVRRYTTPQQIALRARIILSAADGFNNAQIARKLGVNLDTVRLWRQRWIGLQAARLDDLSIEERLSDAPHPGAPARITPEQVCQIVALACTQPPEGYARWTLRLLADGMVRLGYVDSVSHESVRGRP